jgi:PAS domain S-box-containing protein
MRLIHSFRGWLSELPYTDPIERRLAPVLQIFFVSIIAALLFAIVLSILITGLTAEALAGLIPAAIFGLALWGGLYILRRGYFNWAIGIIIVALLFNQARSLSSAGFFRNQQTLLTSMLALTLAAFLLSRRLFLLTALINFLTMTFVAFQEQAAFVAGELTGTTTPVARLTGFGLILILFCILLDMFSRTFRAELAASTLREQTLEAEIIARKKMQQSLAEQREQYRVTLSSIGDAVIATDTAGQVTFLNEVAETLTGWKSDAALGKPLIDVFPIFNEETLKPVENPLTRVLAEGVVVGLANHTVLVRQDGRSIPIADSGAPIRGEDGVILGAVLVFRDVSEERLSENELRESEERFRSMADSAPVLIWISGPDNLCYYFNKRWLDFTGRTLEQESGDGWTEGIHPDDYDHVMEADRFAFDKRQPYSSEYRLRRADGTFTWIIENGDPRFLADGTFIGYIGSCIDISELKQAEERTSLLQMLTAALSTSLTVEAVAQVFMDTGFTILGAQRGILALVDEDQSLEIVGQYNMPEELIQSYFEFGEANTPLGETIRTGQPVWIENFEMYEKLYPHLAQHLSNPSQSQSLVCLPMTVHSRTIGGISIRYSRPQHWDEQRRAFMVALAQQCAQAMERAMLHHQAQLAAALEERQRLARDLHDAVSQTLFSATIMAETIPTSWQRSPERGKEQLDQLITLNRAAMSEMRTLLLELRPEAMLKTDLALLLRQLVEAAKGRKNIRAEIEVENMPDGLPSTVHVALYRIAQESINNILKHSQASQFSVQLYAQAEQASLQIDDDGQGFDMTSMTAGLGLNNIRERAQAIGASLDIRSKLGEGTHVMVTWNASVDGHKG